MEERRREVRGQFLQQFIGGGRLLMCGDKGKVLWAMSAAQVWGGCQGDFGDA